MSASQQQGSVEVGDLNLAQLADVRRQLEAELQHLTASYGQLKAAQHRFRTCIEAVDSIDPSNEDKETLVPLTSSLYVPGKLSDLNKVIVDVGTGYYVEKSTEDAKQMYREKVEFVGKKLDQLQETILRKEDNMRVVRDVSMVKVAEQQQQQQQQQPKA
ncbi:Prefoldin-domain-containing protein [Acaromyces ingoldii]|uniref:Prefoldin-domain-containing protein n=1 Tax=Acaromyces ingoldii TaxID=215250 RepID=A0A316YX43_9BASI|nr:Prefoldin-domain-containing protein [Acaromyces ingoldii]PWN93839.1 Prefoldin-domain-containing protein [Acaromyces ingoldii]